MVYIMYMYVNKRVELAHRGIALLKMYICMYVYVCMYVLLLLLLLVAVFKVEHLRISSRDEPQAFHIRNIALFSASKQTHRALVVCHYG